MTPNVGGIDRIGRAVLGPALMLIGIGPAGARRGRWVGLAALVAGALMTETVITQVCPVNKALGIDTRT